MRMLMKSLLTVSAVLSLAPTAAFAYLPQCYDVCEYSGCTEPCAIGLGTWISCGEYDPSGCVGGVVDPTASVTANEARQAVEASPVCSEENQAAEQAAIAES